MNTAIFSEFTPVVGLVVGTGAGSKFLHSLLDSHPDMYGVPGYSLMYYYPHYKRAFCNSSNKRASLSLLLDRLPSIWDTRLSPGSESLNALGDGGDEYLSIEKDTFQRYIEYFLLNREWTSKSVLLAIHNAHFVAFASHYKSKPKYLLYHIHDHMYIPYLRKDFPTSRIVSTIRTPSLNIPRRTKSGVLEASKDKLSAFDYMLAQIDSFDKTSFYHLTSLFKIPTHNTLYVSFDSLLVNQDSIMKSLCHALSISSAVQEIEYGSFGGIKHTLTFYERHRSMSMESIRNKALSEIQTHSVTAYDICYDYYYRGLPIDVSLAAKALANCLCIAHYEIQTIWSIVKYTASKRLFDDLRVQVFKPLAYDMNHGFFCYKWSSQLLYLRVSNFLKCYLAKFSAKKNSFIEGIVRILLVSFYSIFFILSATLIPFLLLRRVFYQLLFVSIIFIRSGKTTASDSCVR